MEILFCDLCNESVPQADLEAHLAYYRKGRLICRDCDRAMGGSGEEADRATAPPAAPLGPSREAPPAAGAAAGARPSWRGGQLETVPAPSGGGAGGVVLGLLSIAFAGTAAWLLVERFEALEGAQAQDRVRVARSLELAQDEQRAWAAGIEERLAALDQRAEERAAQAAEALEQRVAGLRVELAQFVEREDAVAGALRDLDQRIAEGDGQSEQGIAALRTALEGLEKDQRFYADRLIEFEESVRLLSAGGRMVNPALPLGAAQEPVEAAPQKPWVGLIPDLENDNAGIRLDAIYKLGETKDLAVVPHLVPKLKDEDLFVRMATARMLEDLGAKSAVGDLIEALEDEQSPVREAAFVALRGLTGEDFGFEPVAAPAERAKKVKLWREWWKKDGPAFLAGT